LEDGDFIPDTTNGQDIMAWVTQGDVAARHLEKLGAADIGIIMWRDLLNEQIERVERGEDPIAMYRDPDQNQQIMLPRERTKHGGVHEARMFGGGRQSGVPEYRALVRELYSKAKEEGKALAPTGPVPVFPTTKRVTMDLT